MFGKIVLHKCIIFIYSLVSKHKIISNNNKDNGNQNCLMKVLDGVKNCLKLSSYSLFCSFFQHSRQGKSISKARFLAKTGRLLGTSVVLVA